MNTYPHREPTNINPWSEQAVRGAPLSPATHKLVDADGIEIQLPARRKLWDGREVTVRDFKPSRFEGNEGYVYTTLNETFVPSVCGLKIVRVSA